MWMSGKCWTSVFLTTVLFSVLTTTAWSQASKIPHDAQYLPKDQYFTPKTPEDSIKTIDVPKGYHLECVAQEPMIMEPASFVFDEDGAIYVCEWLTYMQDEFGKNQRDPICRVVKLVDTDGDGKMDKRTVFIDKIMLPRTILPLKDRVLVNITDSTAIYSYFDKDNDGVSDGRELVYKGEDNRGNIEHQASGLIWNLDNYIYTNYKRHKYKDGKLNEVPYSTGRISQWGLARDDDGRVYSSWAGGGNPVHSFQLLGGYPILRASEHSEDFRQIFPICQVEDQSSGNYDFENNHILTQFSATCGQTVYRGTQMPEYYGMVVTPEPVGRFIRLSNIKKNKNGLRVAHNATPQSEFIRGTDAFFRPVWSESGPDGCLYFSDMYRGIIQEKTWFPHVGNHIWVKRYKRVKEWGMLKVFRHGRIYRLVPDGKTIQPAPKLKNLSSNELLTHLASDNGWVRDTAQKLIVYNQDKSVVKGLETLAASAKQVSTKLCALWSLEGLDSLKAEHVLLALDDSSERVKVAAVKLSESFLDKPHKAIEATLKGMIDGATPDVAIQLALAFRTPTGHDYTDVLQTIHDTHATHPNIGALADHEKKLVEKDQLGKSAQAGSKIYEKLCITCHAGDGKGVKDGTTILAPSLANNRWFKKNRIDVIAKILLKGETGPIGKTTYGEGLMLPLEHAYNDQELADVINYIGQRWNRWKRPVPTSQIAKIRDEIKDRKTPYTNEELGE